MITNAADGAADGAVDSVPTLTANNQFNNHDQNRGGGASWYILPIFKKTGGWGTCPTVPYTPPAHVSEINEFVWIRIIYYFKHITFLKKIFKYILIIGYPSFKSIGPFQDPELKIWIYNYQNGLYQGHTAIKFFFLSFAICSLFLKAHFYFIRSIYISICSLICN